MAPCWYVLKLAGEMPDTHVPKLAGRLEIFTLGLIWPEVAGGLDICFKVCWKTGYVPKLDRGLIFHKPCCRAEYIP